MSKKMIEVNVQGSQQFIYCEDLSKIHYVKKKKTPELPAYSHMEEEV